MLRPFCSIVLVLILCVSSAQVSDPYADSLQQVINKQKNDSLKVNALLTLGNYYLANLKIQEALHFGNQAKDLASNIEFKKGLGFAHKLIGQSHYTNAEYQNANDEYTTALELFREIGDKDGIANMLDNLGSMYFIMGDDAKSIEHHLSALRIANEIENKLRIGTILQNLGTVYANKPESYNKAIDYFKQALPLFQELKYVVGISIVSGNLGEVYFKQGNYDAALPYFQTAAAIEEGTPYACFSLSYLGAIYAQKNDFDKALSFHTESVSIAEQQDAKLELLQSLIALGNTLKLKGDVKPAVEAYSKSLDISKSIGAKQETRMAYEALAQCYAALGDFKNAYSFESLLTQLKDTLYNVDESKRIQRLQFNFDLEKKESEIAVHEATIQRQRITNYGIGIVGVLILLISIGIYHRYRFIRQTNKIIQAERDRSKELLLNILPEETAQELETSGYAQTRFYESASVLFTDFKGFSTIAGKLSPQELVAELNDYFMAFDEIVERNNLEKIKTIGDAYMCAGGIPTPNNTHPLDAVKAALAMQQFMQSRNDERRRQGKPVWELRVGIHTGPLVAGVVGKMKYAYDIWGDTVNIASRMESTSEPGKVNISSSTHAFIKEQYACKYRGKISAKNIGEVDMYFIERELSVNEPVMVENQA